MKLKTIYTFSSKLSLVIVIIFSMTILGSASVDTTDRQPYNASDSNMYKELVIMNSEALLAEADLNLSKDTLPDRSVMALTIVANRYFENPKDSDGRKNAITAFSKLGNFYFIKNIDFTKAYKNLAIAQQIAVEDNDQARLAYIYVDLIGVFHNSDLNLVVSDKVREYMVKGMEAAINSDEPTPQLIIALDMAMMAFNENDWKEFEECIQKFKQHAEGKSYPYLETVIKTIEACDAFLNGEHDKSENLLKAAQSSLNTANKQDIIIKLTLDDLLKLIYKKQGDYSKAITTLRGIVEEGIKIEMPTYEISAYNDLAEIYEKLGIQDSVDYYHIKYLILKEQLENKMGYGRVEKLELSSEIDKINEEVEALSIKLQEERRIRILVVAVLIVAIVVLLALIWVYLNLKRNHRNLFQRNEEMLRLSEQHKLLRGEWEEEKKALEAKIEYVKENAATSKDKNINEEIKVEDETDEEESTDNEQLKRIYTRVLAVMEGSKDIFQPGFSINQLSKMVKASQKNVSKAINECHQGNFHQLLNEYRIREVTRIMHTEEAANLTIEAISESVGFKSRTSFTALFKKHTGLPPSEYMRLAHA